MKKIGIITFHRAHNYGAVLQAYALQKAVKNLGFDVGFIDKQNKKIEEAYKLYPKFSFMKIKSETRKLAHLLLDFKRKSQRHSAFESFISENLNLLNVDKNQPNFSSVVLGSDQIWNFTYTDGFDDLYFGEDCSFSADKIVSYAASMGKADLEEKLINQLNRKLAKIDTIGVREDSLRDFIQKNYEMEAEVNLDPTLLLDKDDWQEISAENINKEPYLLVYEVQENRITQPTVNYIAKKLGLRVITLSARTDFRTPKDHISNASPNEYVSLFRNAAYVVTTSFHGTVFSIINNVSFTTIGFDNEIDIRSKSILAKLGIPERMIGKDDEISNIKFDINYTKVEDKLSLMKNQSLSFLKNAIES
ncbi:polysaccharide pyruvyl transferase family protein [Veronia pacifica]|uniref:Polysaccharide pyruvyl transferase domain-containing protein n=1 Tax=Veronia pacifica TaxID=1080227 RepID=A0A1C3ERA0_9GAMM|nr:polysaccharide pyruvyl transferase family protein [Veronia pacifica]ODA35769.1 hypothetical protein A8L45_01645 [Veronia pacifica]